MYTEEFYSSMLNHDVAHRAITKAFIVEERHRDHYDI